MYFYEDFIFPLMLYIIELNNFSGLELHYVMNIVFHGSDIGLCKLVSDWESPDSMQVLLHDWLLISGVL